MNEEKMKKEISSDKKVFVNDNLSEKIVEEKVYKEDVLKSEDKIENKDLNEIGEDVLKNLIQD